MIGVSLLESYLKPFSLKIGSTGLRHKGKKTVMKTGYIFIKFRKVVLRSQIRNRSQMRSSLGGGRGFGNDDISIFSYIIC